MKLFGDKGYDLAWHTVDVSSYGVAQSRNRVVMIGARDGLLKGFSTPVIAPPERRTLAQAAGHLVDRYIQYADIASERREMERTAVEQWRVRWDSELAPEFPNRRESRAIQRWRRLGIDIQDYHNSQPHRAALVTGFKLNNALLKAIQSFPRSWQVEGPSSSNAKLLESSFPPLAARMLGLALHSALTGLDFDYRRAASKPLENQRPRTSHEFEIGCSTYAPPLGSQFLANPQNVIIDQENKRREEREPIRRTAGRGVKDIA
ncbi:DNA cytosine methyltransferase [Pseudorhizobium sp. NPDC055634]